MASVFGASTGKPIVVKAGKATVTVNNKTLIAQGVTISFQRTVQAIDVIGQKKVMSIGEPQGTVTFETILAKDIDAFSAFQLGGGDCSPFSMQISFGGACDMAGKTVTAYNCVASSVTITARGGQGYVGQGVNVSFTALDM